jgi:hypothetical protein
MKVFLTAILLVTGVSCISLSTMLNDSSSISDPETTSHEVEALAIACDRYLSNSEGEREPEYLKHVRRLAKEGKWGTLAKIFSDDRFNYFRVPIMWEVVSVSKAPNAVAFLRTFPAHDNAWHIGMINLPKTRDPAVKAYVLEIAGDKDPWVRSTCYFVCEENRWPDLLEQARVDSSSTERYHPQIELSCGLADDAKSYRVALGDLPKDTPIELPRRLKFPKRPEGEPLFPTTPPNENK